MFEEGNINDIQTLSDIQDIINDYMASRYAADEAVEQIEKVLIGRRLKRIQERINKLTEEYQGVQYGRIRS